MCFFAHMETSMEKMFDKTANDTTEQKTFPQFIYMRLSFGHIG